MEKATNNLTDEKAGMKRGRERGPLEPKIEFPSRRSLNNKRGDLINENDELGVEKKG